MFTRRLGRSDLQVSALGMGCWAIGGPWDWLNPDGTMEPVGWGRVDDNESIRAIHYALDAGINFFDTAANYGCGHSERVLAQALAGRREQAVIATKFGYLVDGEKRIVTEAEPADLVARIRSECESSLRNLNTDHIDLYQFHRNSYDPAKAAEVRDMLEELVTQGKIRWYGWSTDHPESAWVFAQGPHCTAVQHILNMSFDAPQVLAVCEEFDQASVNRSPLAMGMLTGKFTRETTFPADDVRYDWDLTKERPTQRLQAVEAVREYFAASGDPRSLPQIALAWIWARSERTVPIPGFKTLAQAQENIQAAEYGLLTPDQMQKIEGIYGR